MILEPYLGFFHVERPGKPSLVLDLIEEYRAWCVDRIIIKNRTLLARAKTLTPLIKKRIIDEVQNCFATEYAYKGKRLIIRGNADYGHLDDCVTISKIKANRAGNGSPYSRRPVGREAYAAGLEAGYDILPFFSDRDDDQKLFVFARGDHYNSYVPADGQTLMKYTCKTVISAGLNWMPTPEIAVKCEYMHRFFPSGFNNEPSINIGVAYAGFFKH